MNIKEIKRRFDLLKRVNNQNYCLASELAKELKVSKTDLMQFIVDNEELFIVGIPNNINDRKARNLGLYVMNVFLSPAENPMSDEWLADKIEENKDCIYVSDLTYYGSIQGNYIAMDTENTSHNREHLWRNTKEKIDKLVKQGIVGEYTFCIGGISDYYQVTCEYALLGDWEQKLIDNGWKYEKI